MLTFSFLFWIHHSRITILMILWGFIPYKNVGKQMNFECKSWNILQTHAVLSFLTQAMLLLYAFLSNDFYNVQSQLLRTRYFVHPNVPRYQVLVTTDTFELSKLQCIHTAFIYLEHTRQLFWIETLIIYFIPWTFLHSRYYRYL